MTIEQTFAYRCLVVTPTQNGSRRILLYSECFIDAKRGYLYRINCISKVYSILTFPRIGYLLRGPFFRSQKLLDSLRLAGHLCYERWGDLSTMNRSYDFVIAHVAPVSPLTQYRGAGVDPSCWSRGQCLLDFYLRSRHSNRDIILLIIFYHGIDIGYKSWFSCTWN